MSTSSEGQKVIKNIFDNVHNFFPAILEVDKILKAWEEAEAGLAGLDKARAERSASIEAMESRIASLNDAVRIARRDLESAKGATDAACEEQARVEAQLAELRTAHTKYAGLVSLDVQLADRERSNQEALALSLKLSKELEELQTRSRGLEHAAREAESDRDRAALEERIINERVASAKLSDAEIRKAVSEKYDALASSRETQIKALDLQIEERRAQLRVMDQTITMASDLQKIAKPGAP